MTINPANLTPDTLAELRRLLAERDRQSEDRRHLGPITARIDSLVRDNLPALLDAAEAARETTTAEVGLREAVEALPAKWDCQPPGQHPNQYLHRESCPSCSHADQIRRALAEHPAPAPEAEVAAGEREVLMPPGETTREWNILDNGEPYLQPWAEDEDEARSYSNCVTGPLVSRTRTHFPDYVSQTYPATPPADDATDRPRCGQCGPGYRLGDDGCRHTGADDATPAPAEPKTAEVEYDDGCARAIDLAGFDPAEGWDFDRGVRAFLASDWLAALLDRERRAEREQAWRVAAQRRNEARRYYVAWQNARMRAQDYAARADALGAAGEHRLLAHATCSCGASHDARRTGESLGADPKTAEVDVRLTDAERLSLAEYVEDAMVFSAGASAEHLLGVRSDLPADWAREFVAARLPVEVDAIIAARADAFAFGLVAHPAPRSSTRSGSSTADLQPGPT